jgi:signal transduction histidine kinase/CheY-like chemotaxis protein
MKKDNGYIAGGSFLMVFALVCLFLLGGVLLALQNFSTLGLNDMSAVSEVQNVLYIVFLTFIVLACVIVYDAFLKQKYRVQLAEREEKMKSLADVKQRFVSHVSHEMKTPLHAIIGITQQMKQLGDLGMTREEMLEKLESSSLHLQKMVENLLASSEDNWMLNMGEGIFDPAKTILETAESYRSKIMQKGIELNVLSKIQEGRNLKGSCFEIQQILCHLLDNSLKFTSKGRIEVSYWMKQMGTKQGMLHLSVSDTGIGISRDDLPYIFEGWGRSEKGSVFTKEYSGMGLGLAITKRLVSSQGGTITVESKEGVHTKFEISIPYLYAVTGEIHQDNPPPVSIPLSNPSVLVVDDDEFNLLLASSFLKKRQCQVMTAINGARALELLGQHPFDIILLDIHMPKISGLEIAETLRNEEGMNQNTPILAVTATSLHEGLIYQFRKIGIEDYLPKPYQEELLWQKMITLIEKKSNHHFRLSKIA